MPLDAHRFSDRYGWVEDRYGLSWQIIHAGDRPLSERIVPVLTFVGEVCGSAEEATNFYTSVFRQRQRNRLVPLGAGEERNKEGTVRYADVVLEGLRFGAMDSARAHAVSFMVDCATKEEIDRYWDSQSAVQKPTNAAG